jgi:hypothetical protein
MHYMIRPDAKTRRHHPDSKFPLSKHKSLTSRCLRAPVVIVSILKTNHPRGIQCLRRDHKSFLKHRVKSRSKLIKSSSHHFPSRMRCVAQTPSIFLATSTKSLPRNPMIKFTNYSRIRTNSSSNRKSSNPTI